MWVNPNCLYTQPGADSICEASGTFDPTASSTFKNLSTDFQITYGGGGVSGYYGTDQISLVGSMCTRCLEIGSTANISSIVDPGLGDVQFGKATNSSGMLAGLFGVGWGSNLEYKSVIDELFLQGVTKLRAFSLVLGAADQNQSGIIFGGVDTKKFSGPLTTVPILPPLADDVNRDKMPVDR